MSLIVYFPLISALLVFIQGSMVFWRNPKNRLNVAFALFALVITLWLFGTFMMFSNGGDREAAIFWDRFIYGAVVFIPAFMYYFCLALTNRKADFWLYFAYFLSIFFLISIPTNYFVHDLFVYKWGVHTKAGPLHHLFLIYFCSYVLAWFFIVYKQYRHTESTLVRYQIKYYFIAFLILFTIGPTAYLPAYGVSIYPFSYLSGLFFVVIISYAILKYRLMDLRQVARIVLIYIIDAVIVYVFFNSLVWFYIYLWGNVWHPYALLTGVIVAPAFVYGLFNFNKIITRLIDKYFFYSLYDYRQTIIKLTAELSNYNDLNKVVDLIVDTIKATMGLNRAGVLLINKEGSEIHYKIFKVIGFDITNGISLVKDNFLTRYLKKTAKPLVREEMSFIANGSVSPAEKKSFLNLEKEMQHIEASLCLPLLSNKELKGIIVLGAKNSGDPFTKEDLELLTTLSSQAGIAIDNARLYSETKNFNKVLQEKVDLQTNELKTRALHLEKLLKMREEFLDIASHQLKTPVSVIRGTISMFRDGSMDKLPEAEQKKFFDNIYQKTEKLNLIISDILRASEIESEEFKIDAASSKKVQLEELLQSVYSDLKELAERKGIKLELNLLPKKAAPIMTSADFLEQAIYNLVDNAIKYTKQGFVKLELLSEEPGYLTVKVVDSGIGIPEADQKKMFDKFSRAKNAVNMYTDGTGLGLFIAKQIVEAHDGGSLVFTSKEGEGTTFTIKLKIPK